MLKSLPGPRRIKLGIHSFRGTELAWDYPDFFNAVPGAVATFTDWEWLFPPALPALPGLTELRIDGAASLPPNWRQLSSLQRLTVYHNKDWWAEDGAPHLF